MNSNIKIRPSKINDIEIENHLQNNDNERENDSLLKIIFLSLIEPTYSNKSKLWNIFLSFCVLGHVFLMILESIDGPNYYENRKNMSTYPYLFTEPVSILFLSLFLLFYFFFYFL